MPENRQWYRNDKSEGNFGIWALDASATDQMVAIWMATAYTVNMFAVVWSFNVIFGLLKKLVISFVPTRWLSKPYMKYKTESFWTNPDPRLAGKPVDGAASSRPDVATASVVGDVEAVLH